MADNRIAYGLAKKYGIDTKGMSPKEVWDALKGKGVTQDNAEEKYASDGIGGTHEATEAEKAKLKEMGITQSEKKQSGTAEERRLKELGIEKDKDLSDTDNKTFHKTITKAKESNAPKERWKVDTTHSEDFYSHCKCFVGLGGCTVAVVKDGENAGNIVSVCKNQNTKEKGVLSKLLRCAVANGGDRLDAFGEGLFNKYQKNGFEPVSWTPFNTAFAPDGWKPQYGAKKNPIVFYRYVGKDKVSGVTFQDFINNTQPFVGDNGYDEAEKFRNEEIKKYGKNNV